MKFGFLLFLVLSVHAFCSEPIGLVLSGGGAKGAYEAGVWKAMSESGVASCVRVISGTSVGAINAALFASGMDTGDMERLWVSNTVSILSPNPVMVSNSLDRIRKGESIMRDFPDWFLPGKEMDGIMDPDALRNLLENNLPEQWPENAPLVYATSTQKGTTNRIVRCLNAETAQARLDILRASSAIPVIFSTSRIDGTVSVDGGVIDNVPIDPIVNAHSDVRTIYVVYLNWENGLGSDRIDASKYPGVRIKEIIPSKNLHGWSGTMDFSPRKTRFLFDLGYADAKRYFENSTLNPK